MLKKLQSFSERFSWLFLLKHNSEISQEKKDFSSALGIKTVAKSERKQQLSKYHLCDDLTPVV